MKISFLYPKDAFNPKQVDDAFRDESEAIKNLGFTVHLIDTDNFDGKPPVLLEEEKLIYRGWMLTAEKYVALSEKVNNQLMVPVENYLKAHHLPCWYNELKEFTMPSIFGQNTQALYQQWGDRPAFVKDYVKSLKTGGAPIVSNYNQLEELLEKMKKYRGFIEGGIVLREPQELDSLSETRFFVLQDKVYFKEGSSSEMLNFAEKIAEKFQNNLFFYSMDIVKNNEGKLYMIEVGDGQVSDSVGWDNEKFCQIFQKLSPKKVYKP